jgi:hypothetical protein
MEHEQVERYKAALQEVGRKCSESLDFLSTRIDHDATDAEATFAKCAAIMSADSAGEVQQLFHHAYCIPVEMQCELMKKVKWRLDGAAALASLIPSSPMLDQLAAYLEDQRNAARAAEVILRNVPDFTKLDIGLRGLTKLTTLDHNPECLPKPVVPKKTRRSKKVADSDA